MPSTINDDIVAKVVSDRKPKTRRGRKILKNRAPKIVEDAKTALIVRGQNASPQVLDLLRDLHRLRSPLSAAFTRPHDIHPFEDPSYLEKLCRNFDHGLFAFGSSSKKRPFRLILGRMFDGGVLDMVEFKVTNYKRLLSFSCQKQETVLGSKPLVLFQGAGFETDDSLKRAKSLLLDFFSGPRPEKVLLDGLEHVLVVTACEPETAVSALGVAVESAKEPGTGSEPTIIVRRFFIKYQKSGSRLPRVELSEVGPQFTLTIDRTKEPNRDRWKQAIKVPKAVKPKKVKSVSTEVLGKTKGQLHLGKQDYDQIHTVHHSKAKDKRLRAELGGPGKKKARKASVSVTVGADGA